jgi:OOP family OmpA-OmpF porin
MFFTVFYPFSVLYIIPTRQTVLTGYPRQPPPEWNILFRSIQMIQFETRQIALFLFAALSFSACKNHSASNANTPSSASAVSAAAARADVPGPAPAATATATAAEFSLDQVPLTTVTLPPFPLFSFPDALPENQRHNFQDVEFEETYVIAGSAPRKVEGRMSTRFFGNASVGQSATGSRRNYQLAVEALGGVKVNKVGPTDPQLIAREGGDVGKLLKKLRLIDSGSRFEDRGIGTYDCYLIRTAQGNTWMTVTIDSDGLNTFLMTLQEQPLRQFVHALTAESFATALKTDGHLALYLSFDTDQTTLGADSTAVISEVVKLMQSDPTLRLRIEGHTDNAGSEAHNQALSAGRANSVKAALAAQKIDSLRMESKGFGAMRPVDDNATETGRAKNRRVELVKL